MKYLSAEDILHIHSLLIDETGGAHGVRDQHALLSLAGLPKQKVFGRELYPTIFDKAAVYARNIIFGHPFVDGNKRTAMTATSVFLEDNGYSITAAKGEIERFALAVLHEKLNASEIAAWLKNHCRKKTSL